MIERPPQDLCSLWETLLSHGYQRSNILLHSQLAKLSICCYFIYFSYNFSKEFVKEFGYAASKDNWDLYRWQVSDYSSQESNLLLSKQTYRYLLSLYMGVHQKQGNTSKVCQITWSNYWHSFWATKQEDFFQLRTLLGVIK